MRFDVDKFVSELHEYIGRAFAPVVDRLRKVEAGHVDAEQRLRALEARIDALDQQRSLEQRLAELEAARAK